jgi:hypothetical protein
MTARVRLLAPCAIPFVLAALVAACSGVGIVTTDDPYKKVSQAEELWQHQGRLMQARARLEEAIVLFEERGDKLGLGETYRQYGLLSRFDSPNQDVVRIFWDKGTPKPSVGALDVSDRYLTRALALFEETGRSDLVANTNFLLGGNQVARGTPALACPFYDRALAAFGEAEAKQPGLRVELPRGVSSFADGIARVKASAGCS